MKAVVDLKVDLKISLDAGLKITAAYIFKKVTDEVVEEVKNAIETVFNKETAFNVKVTFNVNVNETSAI